MAKSLERLLARKLRRQQGLSIKEIAKRIDVCKSSVSRWCRDIKLTPLQIKQLIEKEKSGRLRGSLKGAWVQKERRLKRIQELREKANREIKQLTAKEFFLAGVALYWAEGHKKQSRLGFANSDPKMILFFLKWLREVCKIPKSRLKCYVGINEIHNQRVEEVENYWSELTNIPKAQFTKVSLKKVKNKKQYANFKDHYGTFSIRVLKGTDLQY